MEKEIARDCDNNLIGILVGMAATVRYDGMHIEDSSYAKRNVNTALNRSQSTATIRNRWKVNPANVVQSTQFGQTPVTISLVFDEYNLRSLQRNFWA